MIYFKNTIDIFTFFPGTPVSVVTHLEEIWFWISVSLL
nr:MAG TPA: hypothetical protein [Caudoviricetes sp.]